MAEKYLIIQVDHAGNLLEQHRLIDYLQETGSDEGISLMSLCRMAIRRHLVRVRSENLFHTVPRLEPDLPQTLPEYLLFNVSLDPGPPKNSSEDCQDMLIITTSPIPQSFLDEI